MRSKQTPFRTMGIVQSPLDCVRQTRHRVVLHVRDQVRACCIMQRAPCCASRACLRPTRHNKMVHMTTDVVSHVATYTVRRVFKRCVACAILFGCCKMCACVVSISCVCGYCLVVDRKLPWTLAQKTRPAIDLCMCTRNMLQ